MFAGHYRRVEPALFGLLHEAVCTYGVVFYLIRLGKTVTCEWSNYHNPSYVHIPKPNRGTTPTKGGLR